MNKNPIVIFDGVCNLCNWAVQFIIKRDSQGVFKFTSAQSEIGQDLLARFNIREVEPKSVFLLKEGKLLEKSTAALEIVALLDGFWKYLVALRLIPRPLRDAVYDFIAKNRYGWFGKRDQCMVPTEALKERFLQRGF